MFACHSECDKVCSICFRMSLATESLHAEVFRHVISYGARFAVFAFTMSLATASLPAAVFRQVISYGAGIADYTIAVIT